MISLKFTQRILNSTFQQTFKESRPYNTVDENNKILYTVN